MVNNISWQGYWTFIVLLLTAYYLVIYLLYYHKDVKVWAEAKLTGKLHNETTTSVPFVSKLDSKLVNPVSEQPSLFEEEGEDDFQPPPQESEEAVVYACIDELHAFLEEAKKSRCGKEQLVAALKGIIQKYPSLKNSAYKAPLNSVIQTQCEQQCALHLSADDLAGVWIEKE